MINYIFYTTLCMGILFCNTSPIIAQTDSTTKTIDPHQDYWDRIAKIPYPKLKKKEVQQLIGKYIVKPIIKEKDTLGFTNFKYKLHNQEKKRTVKLDKANNNILGTLDLTKENGETLTFKFKILITSFLVYSDHYEWHVSRIHVKNNENDEWIRLHDYIQQLK